MNNEELLRVSDFFVILIRGKRVLISVFMAIVLAGAVYLLTAEKSYKISGTIYVGRLQEILLEEGEFVAQKLQDTSFVTRALQRNGVKIDQPVSRLVRKIKTDVVNEIKKIDDVGIVQLSVEYKDPESTLTIYKALTDLLIEEHGQMLEHGANVFKGMEKMFWDDEKKLRDSIAGDEAELAKSGAAAARDSIPSYLLLGHTLAEKRTAHQVLVKDIHYLKLEGESATKSFNTRLASEPTLPDEPFKPKKLLVLVLVLVLATVGSIVATLAMDYYQREIRPRV